jgi:tRNA(fMet)-specific endonuclease VapC
VALLIDTTAFIALERHLARLDASLPEPFSNLADQSVAIAAITASELLVGVHRARTESQRARREAFVEAVLARIPVVAFDLLCARAHARIASSLATSGSMIGAHDLLIAATAVAHGLTLVTSNVEEFQRVPGLQVSALPRL